MNMEYEEKTFWSQLSKEFANTNTARAAFETFYNTQIEHMQLKL